MALEQFKDLGRLEPPYTTLVWIVLVAFILVMLWIGKEGYKHSKTLKLFSIARGEARPWMVGMCFAATYASANLFLGVPGWAYSYGEPVLWWTLGCFGCTWLGLLVFGRKFWQFGQQLGGAITLPEWLGLRYQSEFLRIGVALLSMFNIYYILGQNIGLATMFETSLGIPYFWGLIMASGIIVIYIGLGAAWADIVTDSIQGILMSITGVIIFASLWWTVGGLSGLHQGLAELDPQLVAYTAGKGPFGDGMAIVAIQWLLFSFVLLPHLINKVLALRNEQELRQFVIWAGVGLFFVSAFMLYAGMAARVLAPGLQFPDQAMPVYLAHAFPPVVTALLVAGIFSAVLSTTDGLYVGMASILANDLYRPFVAKFFYDVNQPGMAEKLERFSLRVARLAIVAIGVISVLMALARPKSLAYLTQFGISAIISGVIAPVTLGYFWRRANRVGAIASLLCGAGTYLLVQSVNIVPVLYMNLFKALFVASGVGFVVMWAVSRATTPLPETHTNLFIAPSPATRH